jgi:hypothetical protein
LVPAKKWHTCKERCEAHSPDTHPEDGFIHLTKEPELLLPVANDFYKSVKGAHATSQGRFLPFGKMEVHIGLPKRYFSMSREQKHVSVTGCVC